MRAQCDSVRIEKGEKTVTSRSSKSPAETLEGYVIDIACLRKYPRDELLDRARVHTKRCALMGHCVESGYGLVSEDGRVALLEAVATPQVVHAIERSDRAEGIQLRVAREHDGEEMRTVAVESISREDE
jgi:hypothetical protein